MRIGASAKRWTYLVHRWTGVAGCVLMALWFVSGVVMLYVGYPKLTPWERLAPLPALPAADCCIPLDRIPGAASPSDAALVLTTIGGAPSYVLRDAAGTLQVHSAVDGAPQGPVTPALALAEARVFAPSASLRHAGQVHEDRWTHARGLDAHRPLHRILAEGESPGTLYLSAATGQVVLDAPRYQQRWNYVGAWLHWLYLFRDRPVDPVWSWLVIALSAICTVTAATGLAVGLWRWRFRSRYRSGARTPYQEAWMRWHHITGLLFGGIVCTWIFSGLMSMNPVDVFSPRHGRPDAQAYQGDAARPVQAMMRPDRLVGALHAAGFTPVELQWRRLGGQEYALAYDAQARTRLVRADDQGGLRVATVWQPSQILPAASRLLDQPLTHAQVVTEYDAYYYQRHPEAMNGARMLGLPALRLDYGDPGRTRVYIDLRTGGVAISLDQAQRLGRWLFYFLHSWDTPALLRGGAARDLILIVLSIGGLAVSVAGIVIGWRRMRGKLGWHRPAGKPARQ